MPDFHVRLVGGERQTAYPTVAADDGWHLLIVNELQRLDGERWDRKKKDTVLALLDVRLAGTPEEEVWSRTETCARSTWHEKWKKDPLIADVLERCRTITDYWKDNRAALAIAETSNRMSLESPASLDEVIRVRDQGEDDADRLRAALAILDRIPGLGTKSEQSVTVSTVSADEFATMQRQSGDEARQLEDDATGEWSPADGVPTT